MKTNVRFDSILIKNPLRSGVCSSCGGSLSKELNIVIKKYLDGKTLVNQPVFLCTNCAKKNTPFQLTQEEQNQEVPIREEK